jgi:hypothetical protein
MPPSSLEDLNHAEQLLLLAWRCSPPDGGSRPCVDTVWRRGCGDELGQRTASLFTTVLCCLERGARRPLSPQPPEHAALGAHERAVLELVAACQCGALALAGALAGARTGAHAPARRRRGPGAADGAGGAQPACAA